MYLLFVSHVTHYILLIVVISNSFTCEVRTVYSMGMPQFSRISKIPLLAQIQVETTRGSFLQTKMRF